jgi:polar amino acid transport system substrate-binding protein
MSKIRLPLLSVSAFALLSLGLLAGCGSSSDDSSTSAGTDGASTPNLVSAADCTPDKLDTTSDGKLTIATDKPAYPPYFEDNDPTNGKGFESAMGYGIAKELGYAPTDVDWVVVPFNASYSPGPKDFDFDLNQISITPKRAEQVDFSAPYYTANQAIVALDDSDAASASTLADLADAKIGVQIGTTSLDAVNDTIQPSNDPQVFDTSNDVVSALKQGAVDAVVVDVPTALYLTAVQVTNAKVVGQFPAPGGDQWGALLEKDSSLTDCVSFAVNQLRAHGDLEKITDKWINKAVDAPELK